MYLELDLSFSASYVRLSGIGDVNVFWDRARSQWFITLDDGALTFSFGHLRGVVSGDRERKPEPLPDSLNECPAAG